MSTRGFTLIETIVVIGLIVSICAFSTALSLGAYQRMFAKNDRDAIVTALQHARLLAWGSGRAAGRMGAVPRPPKLLEAVTTATAAMQVIGAAVGVQPVTDEYYTGFCYLTVVIPE